MKAAILGIGTELTEGQIVNKNASWISGKLKELGLTTTCHLVVPDEPQLMREGIEYCASKADLLFITGGLGPTSDDFTRDIVSAWAGKNLIFDEGSWRHVNERLTSRGYTVKEIQRQQCFFPEGAEILPNSEGTANGFHIEVHKKHVFVLPGPPREIAAIWNAQLAGWLKEKTQGLDPYLTYKWDTIGVGESDVALIAEEALRGVDVDKGYRVHLPYVEVKASFYRSQQSKLQPAFDKLTEALKFCTISRDGEDAAALLAKSVEPVSSFCIIDEVSGQFLINRLLPSLRSFMANKDWVFAKSSNTQSTAALRLSLIPKDASSCEVSLAYNDRIVKDIIVSPYKTQNMYERSQQYFAEMAIIFWLKNLNP